MPLIVLSKSPLKYQERHGLVTTRRRPESALALAVNAAVHYPVAPPYPLPELSLGSQGSPSADATKAQIWPFGTSTNPPA